MLNFMKINRNAAEQLAQIKIIPVLVLNSAEEGLALGKILLDNGLPAAEITFRTPAAASAIAAMTAAYPELLLGAGTILNHRDLLLAKQSGAKFAVAPGFNPSVVKKAAELEMPFAPGICTPSELEQAYDLGCAFLKFFPAEPVGGLKFLQAMAAPYKHLGISFMPTGGVTAANAATYLNCPFVAAVGGTWLTKAADVAASVREAVKIKNEF